MEEQRRIAFIGPMGCGKSSVAAAYGEKYNKSVFDTDAVFTRRYGEIKAFFEARGEAEFRKIEFELIAEAVYSQCDLIACGGGVVLENRNMNALRTCCDIVYIDADSSVLEKRIADSERPLKSMLKNTVAARKPLYERYADYTVNGNAALESVVSDLVYKLGSTRKNRYKVLLCDADDTVLDFQSAMRFALSQSAKAVGLRVNENTVISEYRKILPLVWGRLERGEITREMLVDMRFNMLKTALAEDFDISEFNSAYMTNIKKTRFVRDGAIDFLDAVRDRGIKIYIVTNSYKAVACERLKVLDGHTDGAFVSEDIGFDKPDIRFFEWVYENIGSPDKNDILVFGDGVYPDIHGGKIFGADTCLYDPYKIKSSIDADFIATSYGEVLRIL